MGTRREERRTECARTDGGDQLAQHAGQHVHTTHNRGRATNRLEINGQIIRRNLQTAKEQEHDTTGRPDLSYFQNGERSHGIIALIVFPYPKDDGGCPRATEQADDGSAVPGEFTSTPFQGQKYLDGGRRKEEESHHIEFACDDGHD